MKNILITGGAGSIGGSLARALSESGKYHVVIFDNLSTGSKAKLPSHQNRNWTFIHGDVNNWQDISTVMLTWKFDYVFHYAAVVGVKRTLSNPIAVLGDIEGIKNVLSLAKNTGVKRFFFSSSSEVYGEPIEIPQNENTTPLNSRLPYAIVKNTAEAYINSYYKEYGLNFTIFRFFNTYGPLQSTDFVIPKFLSTARENKEIGIYGDGKQTRTFMFIDDNVRVTLERLEKELFINEVVNLGSDLEISILDLAQKVISLSGSNSRIIHLPALAEGDMSRRQPDISKLRQSYNRPFTSIDDGLRKLIEFGG